METEINESILEKDEPNVTVAEPVENAELGYRLQEEERIAAAASKRREAMLQSAGSLSRGAILTPPEQDAFLRAFRAAL